VSPCACALLDSNKKGVHFGDVVILELLQLQPTNHIFDARHNLRGRECTHLVVCDRMFWVFTPLHARLMLPPNLNPCVFRLFRRGRIRCQARFHRGPGSTHPSERASPMRESNKAHFGIGTLSVRSSTRWGMTPCILASYSASSTCFKFYHARKSTRVEIR